MKTVVVIPALDEEASIGDLVRDCLKQPVDSVIVVDNTSADRTAEVARQAGALVVNAPHRGYGNACAAGVAAAEDADVIVFIDGDYSFLPSEMPVVLEPICRGHADLVLGSRPRGYIAPGAMPSHQRLGNALVATMVRRLYGIQLTDLGPYRAIRRDLLISLNMRERTYGWPVEMILKAARRQARLVEVPVSCHPRRGGESKVSGTWRGTLLTGYRFLSLTLRYMR